MAVDPTHRRRIVIGWQQFNSVTSNFRQAGFSYSRDGGETWQPAGVLHPGTYRTEPVLAAGEHGRMYYGSVQGNLRGDLFASNDGGASWNMLGDVCEGAKLWLVVDRRPDVRPDGMCAVAVTPRDGSADVRFTCSTNRGQSFSDPIVIIPKASQAALTVGPDGTVYVAAATGETFQFSSTDDALASKVVPHFGSSSLVDLGGPPVYGVGPNPGGALGRPWIAANHSRGPNRGDLYLLSSIDPSGPDPLDVMFVRSSDGGKSWTTPVRVNDDSPEGCAWQWFGTLSVAPKGRIDAVWNDTRHASAGYSSGLFYSYSVDGGTSWSSNTAVSPAWDPHVGWPQTNTIGDRHHVVSDDTGLYIAYTATFNGEQDIYFVRVPAVLP
jgi:hypothetical protein